jgi:replicative DNA helicase
MKGDLNIETIGAGKIPPQAVDIEEAVLGAVMLEKTVFDRASVLKPHHFYKDSHQALFQAYINLSRNSNPIDMLTVAEELRTTGVLDDIGGMFFLAQITSKISSAAHIEYHCAIILQKYNLREIIRVSMMAADEAFNEGADASEIQSVIFNELEKSQFRSNREPVTLQHVAQQSIKNLQKIQEAGGLTGIDTGFKKLNEIGHGWQSPDLVIIAGRPGTGKTAFAINTAYYAIEQGIPVAFFSLEMSSKQLVDRFISMATGVYANNLKTGNIDEMNWGRIHAQNYNLPLWLDDGGGMSIMEFKSKARRLVRKEKVRMIIVDYLQLMKADVKGNREQEISTISRNLKAIAKELNVPILALAQLSRDVEKRNGKPKLSDLRESGAIEQDADIVITLHNDKPEDLTIQEPTIEVTYAKHRNGACLSTDLIFRKPILKFITPLYG